MITQGILKSVLSYSEATGVFTWITSGRNKPQLNGKKAGGFDGDGYITIKINRRPYKAHNLAWLYVHGKFPDVVIDHVNGIRNDNSIGNLREATFAENSQNQRNPHKDNRNKMLGVDYNKSKKRYRARIQICGKRITLGGFDTAEQAYAAYLSAKRINHPSCSI